MKSRKRKIYMHEILIKIDQAKDWCNVFIDREKALTGHASDVLETGELLARLETHINLHDVKLSDIEVEYVRLD